MEAERGRAGVLLASKAEKETYLADYIFLFSLCLPT